ncbi:hypothetical protein IWX49DRAFT_558747 [Phyllosticta citricarpa]
MVSGKSLSRDPLGRSVVAVVDETFLVGIDGVARNLQSAVARLVFFLSFLLGLSLGLGRVPSFGLSLILSLWVLARTATRAAGRSLSLSSHDLWCVCRGSMPSRQTSLFEAGATPQSECLPTPMTPQYQRSTVTKGRLSKQMVPDKAKEQGSDLGVCRKSNVCCLNAERRTEVQVHRATADAGKARVDLVIVCDGATLN